MRILNKYCVIVLALFDADLKLSKSVTLMKFCSGTWYRITWFICLQTTQIIMAGTLSELLLFVINNTGQQVMVTLKKIHFSS